MGEGKERGRETSMYGCLFCIPCWELACREPACNPDSNKEDAIEDEEEEDEEEEDDLEVKEENGILVLNDANFDNFVADKDTVLLEFYAPWCGHCKQFAPEYEKIASTLKENDPPVPVAKIDATSESALASRFDVSGYPTIKILKKGQAVDYEGSRTQEGPREGQANRGRKAFHASSLAPAGCQEELVPLFHGDHTVDRGGRRPGRGEESGLLSGPPADSGAADGVGREEAGGF
ncbi:protein disulfide-isomerase A4-like isoform X2 [Artibeus jamaicensis]|uniref:protein disulfide-isomerase A4-like isoform X2 n=2 Tax=Artibeus jamaicensis TaxID=9417 RepID=UPI00235AD082|nr:protein disulfide-isomerase A4-like isoform X2 [Artibeus jamaicensis]